MSLSNHLSRRERQIMDIVFELGEASAKEVQSRMTDAPSYSAIRATIAKLEKKGFLNHRAEDLKYVYFPTIDQKEAKRSAMSKLLKTFFDGSASQAMSTLLNLSKDEISDKELEELERMIEEARAKKGKS